MKNKLLTSLLVTTMLAGTAVAQTASNSAKTWGVKNPLFDKVAGKLNLTANVGYVYNFASKWDSNEVGTGKANGGFGYGARIGWTHNSGFGISGDYLGFTSKWQNNGMDYTNPYHILTIAPSYRFSFGADKTWGLKVGLGVGMSLADVSWGTAQTAKGASGKVAGGAVYYTGSTCRGVAGVYSDSKGGVGSDGATYGANQCKIDEIPLSVGVSDKALADIAKGALIYFTYLSGTISYGVWRRLGADEAAAITKFNVVKNPAETAGDYTGNFETRADYISRCGEAAATGVEAGTDNTCVVQGSAKDDAGFVLAPEVALEYDNGLLHADINARYIHGLANVKYDGQNGAANQLQKSGPLAVFVGAGVGVNF